MSWIDSALLIAVAAGVIVVVGAGVYLYIRSPAFWIGVGKIIFDTVWPLILEYVMRRMPPELEEHMAKWARSNPGYKQGDYDAERKRWRKTHPVIKPDQSSS